MQGKLKMLDVLKQHNISQKHMAKIANDFFDFGQISPARLSQCVNSRYCFTQRERLILKKTLQMLGIPEKKTLRIKQLQPDFDI